jgi:hypothetical protein
MSGEKSGDNVAAKISDKITDQAVQAGLSFAESIAKNFSFELPPPFGSGIAKTLGLIFGEASGSGGATADQIQQMLNAAINAIKQFMSDLKLQDMSGDVTSFLTWVQDTIDKHQTETDSDDELRQLLHDLVEIRKFRPGTLFSDLVKATMDDTYIRANEYIDRNADKALSFIVSCLTARLIGEKAIALTACQLASNAYRNGLFKTENDAEYQKYLERFRQAVFEMSDLLRSRLNYTQPKITVQSFAQEMPARSMPEQFSLAGGPDCRSSTICAHKQWQSSGR